ncbi:hypothetical protein ACRAWD_03795 [Caulobacter segnis]
MMVVMDVESAARGLVAAGQLARLSAQTQARMTEWDPDSVEPSLWANAAFRQNRTGDRFEAEIQSRIRT